MCTTFWKNRFESLKKRADLVNETSQKESNAICQVAVTQEAERVGLTVRCVLGQDNERPKKLLPMAVCELVNERQQL